MKLAVNEGLWGRNCATIQQVVILKFAFGREKFPGLSRKGAPAQKCQSYLFTTHHFSNTSQSSLVANDLVHQRRTISTIKRLKSWTFERLTLVRAKGLTLFTSYFRDRRLTSSTYFTQEHFCGSLPRRGDFFENNPLIHLLLQIGLFICVTPAEFCMSAFLWAYWTR